MNEKKSDGEKERYGQMVSQHFFFLEKRKPVLKEKGGRGKKTCPLCGANPRGGGR
jgi:hypothetical protein